MSVSIVMDMASVNAVIQGIGESINEAIRPAAQAAAQVVYEQARANVRRLKQYTGNLERSIYQWYDTTNSTDTRAVYRVSWRTKGKGGARAPHGGLVEYGHLLRYEYYHGKDGRFHIKVRPENKGKPWPKKSASRAVKDAFFQLRAVPIQVPARAFMRSIPGQIGNKAIQAARAVIIERLNRQGGSRALSAIRRGLL